MKGASCPWHPKGRDERDSNVGSQQHKLKDAPPCDNIHLTSNGIEAIRPQSEKFRTVDSWRAPESEYTTTYDNRKLGEEDFKAAYGPFGREEYNRESGNRVYEEDINAEAEEFIEMEHQKLKLPKYTSTNSISYRNQD